MHTITRDRVAWAIVGENPSGSPTCRRVIKKGNLNKNFFVIFHPFTEKPPVDGFARNFAQGVASRT